MRIKDPEKFLKTFEVLRPSATRLLLNLVILYKPNQRFHTTHWDLAYLAGITSSYRPVDELIRYGYLMKNKGNFFTLLVDLIEF